jgi:hypothetical protein
MRARHFYTTLWQDLLFLSPFYRRLFYGVNRAAKVIYLNIKHWKMKRAIDNAYNRVIFLVWSRWLPDDWINDDIFGI